MNQAIRFQESGRLPSASRFFAAMRQRRVTSSTHSSSPKTCRPKSEPSTSTPTECFIYRCRRGGVMTAKPSKDPKGFRWKRFATGFHNGCGMHIVKPGHLIISQMAELTEVIDTDADGVADEYVKLETGIGLERKLPRNQRHLPGWQRRVMRGQVPLRITGRPQARLWESIRKSDEWVAIIRPFSTADGSCTGRKDGAITPFSSGYRMHNGIEFDPKTRCLVRGQPRRLEGRFSDLSRKAGLLLRPSFEFGLGRAHVFLWQRPLFTPYSPRRFVEQAGLSPSSRNDPVLRRTGFRYDEWKVRTFCRSNADGRSIGRSNHTLHA